MSESEYRSDARRKAIALLAVILPLVVTLAIMALTGHLEVAALEPWELALAPVAILVLLGGVAGLLFSG